MSAFCVCADGDDYELDLSDPDVRSSSFLRIAWEIADSIQAPRQCVRVDAVHGSDRHDYAQVTVTILAPIASGGVR